MENPHRKTESDISQAMHHGDLVCVKYIITDLSKVSDYTAL